MRVLVVIGAGLALLLVAFALQNDISVTVVFLLWRFQSTLAFVMLLSLAAGFVTAALLSVPSIWRRRGALSRQRREATALRESLAEKERRIAALQSARPSATDASSQGRHTMG